MLKLHLSVDNYVSSVSALMIIGDVSHNLMIQPMIF